MDEHVKPVFFELAEKVAQWCINRAEVGDVAPSDLADNFAAIVKRIIAAKAN